LAIFLLNCPGGLAAGIALLGALTLGALRLLPLLQQLFYSWTSLSGSRSVTDDVLRLLALPLAARPEARETQVLALQRSIRFERVCFTYPGSAVPAVADASFEIPAGASIAFAGRMGSGKSTMPTF